MGPRPVGTPGAVERFLPGPPCVLVGNILVTQSPASFRSASASRKYNQLQVSVGFIVALFRIKDQKITLELRNDSNKEVFDCQGYWAPFARQTELDDQTLPFQRKAGEWLKSSSSCEILSEKK
jgi:hypothetical protein